MRRLLIAGSRGAHFPPESIDSALLALHGGFPTEEQFTVVTGGARGADTYGFKWSEDRGHVNEVMNADWDKYGNRAGYIRNQEMVDSEINFALVFWDGKSKGAAHTMKMLRDAQIDHVVIITYMT